ncbi:hypothetical protein [Actinokineospora sp. NBRC 105648]|uniref:hypothetical protein n=1 Tax=Actinokineospora sp. NBRC 105648 TaxID=3032206 RepID=UPI0024A22980|nr:hypothetical protein [Actinokineospora sp. NBRC 105648]GLZ40782.1 hypothetical protein Acsp05_44060 [Actinokineospora sp. NBRC 105648]
MCATVSGRGNHRTSAAALTTGTAAVAAPVSGEHAAMARYAGDSDGFEGDPWIRWERFTSGDGATDVNYGLGFAHNGANNGWLYAAHGWAAERLRVSVDSWPNRHNCRARVWARPVDQGAQVELQVWDPNGWRILTSTAPWLSSAGYQKIVTSGVDLTGVPTVYVQAIYGNSTGAGRFVRLDDAVLECL